MWHPTNEQREWFRENCRGKNYRQIAEAFTERFDIEMSAVRVKSFMQRNHLRTGLPQRFQLGHIPYNKGKHMKPPPNVFKPGNIPHNHLPVGTERVQKHGYLYVKIAEPNIWRPKSVLFYEAAFGPVPEGYHVVFADRDIRNFNIWNLKAVPVSEISTINRLGLPYYSPASLETARYVARLASAISRVQKNRHRKRKKELREQQQPITQPGGVSK